MKYKDRKYTVDAPQPGYVAVVVSDLLHGPTRVVATHTYMTYMGFIGMDPQLRREMLNELIDEAMPFGEGVSTEDKAEPLTAHGVKVIGDMSRDELLAEIRVHQEAAVSSMDDNELKHHVIRMRAQQYLGRLHNEARFDPPPFGFPGFGHE